MVTKSDSFWNFFVLMAGVTLALFFLANWVPGLNWLYEFSPVLFAFSVIFMTVSMWETPGNPKYSLSGIVLMLVGGVLGYFGGDLVIGSLAFVPGLTLWLFAALRYCRNN